MTDTAIALYQVGYSPPPPAPFLPTSTLGKYLPNPTYLTTLTYFLINPSDSITAKMDAEMENMKVFQGFF